MSFDRREHTTGFLHKIKFYIVYVKMLFLIDSILSASRTTDHVLSRPLTLECVWILSWFIHFFFYFYCLSGVLCKIAIWAYDTALNSSFDKPFDLSQQMEPMSCNLILKMWKCNIKISKNAILQLYIYIWEIILSLQANPCRLKNKDSFLLASFLLAPLLNN